MSSPFTYFTAWIEQKSSGPSGLKTREKFPTKQLATVPNRCLRLVSRLQGITHRSTPRGTHDAPYVGVSRPTVGQGVISTPNRRTPGFHGETMQSNRSEIA